MALQPQHLLPLADVPSHPPWPHRFGAAWQYTTDNIGKNTLLQRPGMSPSTGKFFPDAAIATRKPEQAVDRTG
ncbi:hypothetical protein [Sandarakinorhabdus glacialis]|uniref:hypothetical protein n=1 Tax=Sandarakinorhabdus glacialis TaxID=1614636 RepID=UPI00166AA4C0|nr:hypothetical protein [Polymorphobacter glacialis]